MKVPSAVCFGRLWELNALRLFLILQKHALDFCLQEENPLCFKSSIIICGNKLESIRVSVGSSKSEEVSLFAFYIFLILFLQRWLKTGEEPMRLSVEWEP